MKKLLCLLLVIVFLLPIGVEAQTLMAQTITVPNREYLPGTYEVELRQLPGNSAGAEFIFTRDNLNTLPADIVAHVDVYMSLDNRVTWKHVQGLNISGGIILDRQGNPLMVSRFLFTWPGEAGPNGRVALKGSDVKVVAEVFSTFSTAITINSITSTGK